MSPCLGDRSVDWTSGFDELYIQEHLWEQGSERNNIQTSGQEVVTLYSQVRSPYHEETMSRKLGTGFLVNSESELVQGISINSDRN